MNLKEALVEVIGMPTSDKLIEKVLLDSGFIGTETYVKENATAVEVMVIDVLLAIWLTPDITEGGYSIKYNRDALKSRLLLLAKKHGRDDVLGLIPKPVIRNASNSW